MKNERDGRTCAIIGAAMEVHRQLGCGFLEAVYQEAMEIECETRGIPLVSQPELPIHYKNSRLKTFYRSDLICLEQVVVELKAIRHLGPIEDAQLLNYLKATGYHTGLLINFGHTSLEYRRLVF